NCSESGVSQPLNCLQPDRDSTGERPLAGRVAGCATPTGSTGHAGATANLKLTSHLHHPRGRSSRRMPQNILIVADWRLASIVADTMRPRDPNDDHDEKDEEDDEDEEDEERDEEPPVVREPEPDE